MSAKSVGKGVPARCLWRVGFEKRKVLRLERKNDGVMGDEGGDDDTGEVRRSWRLIRVSVLRVTWTSSNTCRRRPAASCIANIGMML